MNLASRPALRIALRMAAIEHARATNTTAMTPKNARRAVFVVRGPKQQQSLPATSDKHG